MTRYAVHLDRFTAGLDDMKRKDQADPEKVLAMLREIKRFSVFEASENPVIAKTMTCLSLDKGCRHRRGADMIRLILLILCLPVVTH